MREYSDHIIPFSFHALMATTVLRTNEHLFFSHDVYEILIPPPPQCFFTQQQKRKISIFQLSILSRVKIQSRCHLFVNSLVPKQYECLKVEKQQFSRVQEMRDKGKKLSSKSNSPNMRKCMKVGGLKLPVATRITYILLLFHWEKENECHNS